MYTPCDTTQGVLTTHASAAGGKHTVEKVGSQSFQNPEFKLWPGCHFERSPSCHGVSAPMFDSIMCHMSPGLPICRDTMAARTLRAAHLADPGGQRLQEWAQGRQCWYIGTSILTRSPPKRRCSMPRRQWAYCTSAPSARRPRTWRKREQFCECLRRACNWTATASLIAAALTYMLQKR